MSTPAAFLPSLYRLAKRVAVYPRFYLQYLNCRISYLQYQAAYPQKIIFIAGLPKSGTTWVKRMISSYPGFHEILIPDVAAYEILEGGSHDYDLPPDIFLRFKNLLLITKMHVHGSLHNAGLLKMHGIHYLVLFRDLRDAAVSYYFYVRKTPWHPDFEVYRPLTVERGLFHFADSLLGEYAAWVESWRENADPALGLLIRYEDLLDSTFDQLERIANHFNLDASSTVLERIIDQNSFRELSGGREQGQSQNNSFFRKGIQGDWMNHFTPQIKDLYKERIGQFLIEFGYEDDLSW